jgi:hypothetical protein
MAICSLKKIKIGDFLFEKRECPTTTKKIRQNISPNDKTLVPKKKKKKKKMFAYTLVFKMKQMLIRNTPKIYLNHF